MFSKKSILAFILALTLLFSSCGKTSQAVSGGEDLISNIAQKFDFKITKEDQQYVEPEYTMQVKITSEKTAQILIENLDVDLQTSGASYTIDFDYEYLAALDYYGEEIECATYQADSDDKTVMNFVANSYYDVLDNALLLNVTFDVSEQTSEMYGIEEVDIDLHDIQNYCLGVYNGVDDNVYVDFSAQDVVVDDLSMSDGTQFYLWPAVVQKVESDNIYFVPESDDYAYFIESQDGVVDEYNHPTVLLYEFDEYGNITKVTKRAQKYENEYYYESYDDFYSFELEWEYAYIYPEMFASDKEMLSQNAIKNYGYALFSNPNLDYKFNSPCKAEDFELLQYYTPSSEDYYVQSLYFTLEGFAEEAMHTLVVEFNEDGSTNKMALLVDAKYADNETIQVFINDGFSIADEEKMILINEDMQSIFEHYGSIVLLTKQECLKFFLELQGKLITDYDNFFETAGGAIYFSQPYFTGEALDIYNKSIQNRVMSNAIFFEEKYDDKITFTIADDGLNFKYVKLVYAFEDDKVAANYMVVEGYPQVIQKLGFDTLMNAHYYDVDNTVYIDETMQNTGIVGEYSKDEVIAMITEAYAETQLLDYEYEGIDYDLPENKNSGNLVLTSYPKLTSEQLAEKEAVLNPTYGDPLTEGIYAFGIEKFEGDEMFFTPITDDWELVIDASSDEFVQLICYDEQGKPIYEVLRYVSEDNLWENSKMTRVESPQDFNEYTYAQIGDVYYIRPKNDVDAQENGTDKASSIKTSANDDFYKHYYSKPE